MDRSKQFWTRLAIFLAIVSLLLPDSVAWDNVDRRFSYGIFTVSVSVSPFSGEIWNIRVLPGTDFPMLGYALKLMVAALLVALMMGPPRPSIGQFRFALILLVASFLAYNERVLYYAFAPLWSRPYPITDPSLGLVGGIFGWLGPGKGAVTLATPFAIGLAVGLAMAWKSARSLLPLPKEALEISAWAWDRGFSALDKSVIIGLAGYLTVVLGAPWFFQASVLGYPLIHGLAGYFAVFAVLRIFQALGHEKAALALRALFGPRRRSKAMVLIMGASMLGTAGYYLWHSLNIVWIFSAGFMVALALPLLTAAALNRVPQL